MSVLIEGIRFQGNTVVTKAGRAIGLLQSFNVGMSAMDPVTLDMGLIMQPDWYEHTLADMDVKELPPAVIAASFQTLNETRSIQAD